jgi:uncharacterized YigZ family protein
VRTSYRTVAGSAEGEIEVSRSRFRCLVERVEDEVGARAVVDAVRRTHWDARHHCSAFVLGPDGDLVRSSDDGEPPGTGGAPILDVLRGEQLSDVVAVVTRWFGGVLLGTGGLARAYADATRAALDRAVPVERVLHELHCARVDHAEVGRLEHDLRARGVVVLGIDYSDQAELRLAVQPTARAVAAEIVAELTGGRSALHPQGRHWVDR